MELQRERDALSSKADRWNNWYIGFLVGTVLVAAGALISQWSTIAYFRRAAAASLSLEAAKDRDAAAKFAAKDAEIASLQERTAIATQRASQANERAETAIAGARDLEKQAEALRADAERSRLLIAQAQERAADANRATERLRAKNARVQTLMLPRRVLVSGGDDSARAPLLKELSRYLGQRAVVLPVADVEAQQLALLIKGLLVRAGWSADLGNTLITNPPSPLIPQGVELITLEASFNEPDGTPKQRIPFSRAGNAARALVAYLELDLTHSFAPAHVDVRWRSEHVDWPSLMRSINVELPQDVVVVIVGLKPISDLLTAWRPEDED